MQRLICRGEARREKKREAAYFFYRSFRAHSHAAVVEEEPAWVDPDLGSDAVQDHAHSQGLADSEPEHTRLRVERAVLGRDWAVLPRIHRHPGMREVLDPKKDAVASRRRSIYRLRDALAKPLAVALRPPLDWEGLRSYADASCRLGGRQVDYQCRGGHIDRRQLAKEMFGGEYRKAMLAR
jgi:hypothetical protein